MVGSSFGIGVIAPLVLYKLDVEDAALFSFAVSGPLFGFIIGAPMFFTLPLLMFTKQLERCKKRALAAYQDRATEASLHFENQWFHSCPNEICELFKGDYLHGLKNLSVVYEHIRKMRVVPFDTRSFAQLLGSTVGSLIPIIPKLISLPEPANQFLEIIKPWLH